MIKYHGTPCSPKRVFFEAFSGRNALIPFPRPDNMKTALAICDKIILDNGAFSAWKKGIDIDWDDYYSWVDKYIDRIEFFFIPDVIDGAENQNDMLVLDYEQRGYNKGVPVWHVNESLERLLNLSVKFSRIAIGSAGEYSTIGATNWRRKMREAMNILCDDYGVPVCKIHILRCLDPKIFTQYPFTSGDSTNVARNHHIKGWQPIMNRIEKYNSPDFFDFGLFRGAHTHPDWQWDEHDTGEQTDD